jgi:hypothetical protein
MVNADGFNIEESLPANFPNRPMRRLTKNLQFGASFLRLAPRLGKNSDQPLGKEDARPDRSVGLVSYRPQPRQSLGLPVFY